MSIQPKTVMALTAVMTGAAFLAYCLYFDRKRRQEQDFKKKRLTKKASKTGTDGMQVLNLQDTIAVRNFVYGEFDKGRELLTKGHMEEGLHHLATAIALCGEQEHLLKMLEQSMPPLLYNLLVQKIPEIKQKMLNGKNVGAVNP
ncbi:hypothetical protein GE061_006529 [Apolygus lucorum]|uniref:Mitochondrial import receptor subunit TOM20 homolog n=1 Tax=Apolygus lucorum TaxID=248454 RepID=A0A8S9WWQ8_APOLU|nr:hypothetical protein GE061_006529 [Apolygus lucorum]